MTLPEDVKQRDRKAIEASGFVVLVVHANFEDDELGQYHYRVARELQKPVYVLAEPSADIPNDPLVKHVERLLFRLPRGREPDNWEAVQIRRTMTALQQRAQKDLQQPPQGG